MSKKLRKILGTFKNVKNDKNRKKAFKHDKTTNVYIRKYVKNKETLTTLKRDKNKTFKTFLD